MPNVELGGPDVQVLREAADALIRHGETGHAQRVESLADYINAVVRPGRTHESLPGPRPRDFGQVYEEEVTPNETP